MMDIGEIVLAIISPILEFISPMVPGDIFPYYFTMELFQRALVSAVLVTIVAGLMGSFLLIRKTFFI